MIREIHGTVLALEPSGAVLDVSGWGVLVHVPPPSSLPLARKPVSRPISASARTA